MEIDSGDKEKEILKHILEIYLGRMREEIVKTGSSSKSLFFVLKKN